MNKVYFLCFITLITGCSTTPSTPHKNRALKATEGVVIFSTIDDGSTSEYGVDFARASSAVVTFGLSEIGNRHFELSFKKDWSSRETHPSTFKEQKDFSPSHSYKNDEAAKQVKWHIIPVTAGSYYLSELKFKASQEESRIVSMPWRLLKFTVDASETIYLGDFKLALNEMTMIKTTTRKSNFNTSTARSRVNINAPMIKSLSWNEAKAINELAKYPNFSQKIKKAKYNQSRLKKYLKSQ